MIRIRVLSDLHLEFQDWVPPAVPADVIVLAGDIAEGTHGLRWARQHFPDSPILYVPGNHEYFGMHLRTGVDVLRQAAREHDVTLLDGDECSVGGVRFLGATLWTDFSFDGVSAWQVTAAMEHARRRMVDYQAIRWEDRRQLAPQDTRSIHLRQRQWLEERLLHARGALTVVITHHLPHRKSVHARYAGDTLNPGFVTHLPHLVQSPVALWIHGHTHESMDYLVRGTRVVCNPRGYVPAEPNPGFDPLKIVVMGA